MSTLLGKLESTPKALSGMAKPGGCLKSSSVTSAQIVSWAELDDSCRSRWRFLRTTQPEFRTPFFSLEFFDAVHSARGDVDVIMLHERSELVGMLPMHRHGRVAVPAGRYFNDAHNIVIDPRTKVDWMMMLRQCHLKSYDFHALVGNIEGDCQSGVMGTTESFRADLGDDSASFLCTLERNHRAIRRQSQKNRKLEREIGPIELEIDCRDPGLLAQAIQWKRDQYRRTNILDLFTPDWTRGLIGNLTDHQPDEHPASSLGNTQARGILSVLRAGGQVVAMHVGMIEAGLLHYWFPAYERRYARYSPGTSLFKAIVRDASRHGIHCIDMGYGEQPYKRKQTDTITKVSHGCVSVSRAYKTWRRTANTATIALKRIPMKKTFKRVLRCVQPHAGISKLN